jgi:DNA-cytosine methyltransferase
MNHLDLFSGIGGFAIALDLCNIPVERRYYSDIEEYTNAVYAKNFPTAHALGDIRSIDGAVLRVKHPDPWIVTGGFPCQDISVSGHRKGLAGERSGLWFEMLRVIRELKPELVLIENVAALRGRGLIEVLRGLDCIGYMGEWRTLSAQEVGACHQRKRLWIIAEPIRYTDGSQHTANHYWTSCRRDVGDFQQPRPTTSAPLSRTEWETAKAEGAFLGEPFIVRKPYGLPHELDIDPLTFKQCKNRNKSLGNAIVPQVAARVLGEYLGLQP